MENTKLIPSLIIFHLFSLVVVGQDKAPENYIPYHKKINRAEILFFMEDKVDSSLAVYDEVFKKYDFIFVKDLVNAAQIAHFSHKPYKKYLKKGFEFGLKFEHLKNYPLFKDEWKGLKKDQKMQRAYAKNREKYLQNIDFYYLDWIYQIYIQDQFDKNRENYKNVIRVTLRKLKDRIERKGFPGEKIIGIEDSTIFAEIGKPQLDLKERIKKYGDKLWYMVTEDEALSATEPFVLMVHHRCSYSKMKELLWKEMKKGNIHPRDIGMVYDNIFRFSDRRFFPYYCDRPKEYIYFRLNTFEKYPERAEENSAETNALRKSFYIVPLAVDKKKKMFEEKYGFVIFTRFFAPLKKLEPIEPWTKE